jgi:hypothetical protein
MENMSKRYSALRTGGLQDYYSEFHGFRSFLAKGFFELTNLEASLIF